MKRRMSKTMCTEKKDSLFEMKEMEKWLTNLYLDPLTSFLDETTFRIDIFETDEEYILEAMLNDFESKEISVYVRDRQIEIKAEPKKKAAKEKKVRVIELPFKMNKKVRASFSKGILEIYISKTLPGSEKNRKIQIS
jgi:HSP20 family molecular chaperone IbpA